MRNLAHLLSGTPELVEQVFAAGGGIDLVWRLLDHYGPDQQGVNGLKVTKGWLLIFDNADDPALLTSPPSSSSSSRQGGWLRTPMHGGRVLVTTRVSDPARWPYTARSRWLPNLHWLKPSRCCEIGPARAV